MKWNDNMDEAPRDDCRDVLLMTTEGIELAWWADGPKEWLSRDGNSLYGYPTHWMPLPEPPR